MNGYTRTSFAALTLLMMVGAATGQTITVDISDADIIDVDPETATVPDLPGPDGHTSFSEAMIASNNTPGRQTVGFAIPTSEWTYLPWYYPGRAVVHGMMFYANAYAEVTIDGTTQTAFTGDTNPDGWEVVILRGGGLYVPADNCTLTGLDRTSVYFEGSNGVVENTSEMGIQLYGGFGGSGTLVRGNTGGGYVQIDQSNDNVVVGNTFDRVRVLGWIGGGRPATNNRIGGPTVAERNYIIGLGTWNSQGWPSGFAVQIFNAIGTVVENNWIGTTPDGLQQGHLATTAGIYFDDENYDTTIRGNRIAGILGRRIGQYPGVLGQAIAIAGFGSGIEIVGNTIGLDANGAPSLGSVTGIATGNYYLGPVQNVVIGGSAAGAGNEIAGHLGSGVSVANTFSGVRISGNSIHDNGNLGIDLITNGYLEGVTLNDPLDLDTGGNGLQNFPQLDSATGQGAAIRVVGALHSSPLGQFTIEFFSAPNCDGSGFGEGRAYLGSASVSTDAAGDVDFDVVLGASVEDGWVLTATATLEPSGSTSEFSACIAISGSAFPGDLNCDGVVNFDDINPFVLALSDPAAYAATYPDCPITNGDCNGDGFVNFDDINAFVALLSGS
jgi:hypothetical protein